MFLITSQPKINYVGNELSLNNVHMYHGDFVFQCCTWLSPTEAGVGWLSGIVACVLFFCIANLFFFFLTSVSFGFLFE